MALAILTQPIAAAVSRESLFPEYTGSKAQVKAEAVSLRSYPSEYSEVIGEVDQEDLFILGCNKAWYRVRVDGKEGWIDKAYVKVADTAFLPYSKVIGEEVVDYGKQFIGTPYVWGGNDLRKGVDCSGLTKKVYEDFDIKLSRLSYTQVGDGKVIPKSQLRPGDLVFFDTSGTNKGRISHVGIYAGNGMFLHADCTRGVTLSSLSSSYYLRNYVTGTRILTDA